MQVTKLKKGQPFDLRNGPVVFECDGQRYRIEGRHAHKTIRGDVVDLLDLSSACSDCGATFTTAVVEKGLKAYFTRRCPLHHRKGVSVRYTKPRPAKHKAKPRK